MSTVAAARRGSRVASGPSLRRDRVTQTWVAVATFSWFGDAVFTVALTWTAVHLLSPAEAGLVLGAQTLPQAILMLGGGVIADRFNTRKVMIGGELTRVGVLVTASVAWASGNRSASVLLTVGILFGVAAGLTNPARATLARQLVRAEDLVRVGGWVQLGSRLARLAGAPVGAVLVAAGGLGSAMLLDALSFAAVAVVLLVVIRPRYSIPRTAREPWRADMRDGLSYLRRTPGAKWLTAGLSSLNVLLTPVIGVGVAVRVTRSGWGATWLGVMEASLAAGAITGSLIAIRHRKGALAKQSFRALAAQGLALGAIGVPARACVTLAMFAVGLTSGLASVWLSGVFQQTIAPTHLGRVSSMSQLGDLTLTPVALPLFGFAVASAGVLLATVVCGFGMTTLCLFFATRPAIRVLSHDSKAQHHSGSPRRRPRDHEAGDCHAVELARVAR